MREDNVMKGKIKQLYDSNKVKSLQNRKRDTVK